MVDVGADVGATGIGGAEGAAEGAEDPGEVEGELVGCDVGRGHSLLVSHWHDHLSASEGRRRGVCFGNVEGEVSTVSIRKSKEQMRTKGCTNTMQYLPATANTICPLTAI